MDESMEQLCVCVCNSLGPFVKETIKSRGMKKKNVPSETGKLEWERLGK